MKAGRDYVPYLNTKNSLRCLHLWDMVLYLMQLLRLMVTGKSCRKAQPQLEVGWGVRAARGGTHGQHMKGKLTG